MLLLSLLICSQPGTNTRIAPTYSRCKYQIDMSVGQLSDYSNDDTTQVAAVLTAKDCIAAATYQINLAHARYSLCFTMGQKMPPPPKKLPLPLGDLGPHLIHGSLVQPKSYLKRGTSIGSAILGLTAANCRHAQTDTHAHNKTLVTTVHILCSAQQCGLTIIIIIIIIILNMIT